MSDNEPPLTNGEPSAPEDGGNAYSTPGKRGFKKGNPGRLPGTKTKLMALSQKLMGDEGRSVVEAVITAAKAGDMVAAKLVVDRIHPRPRDPVVKIELPECNSLQDFPAVTNAILDAVAEGEISPSEGNAIANGVLAAHQRSFEISSLEQRINAIEEKLSIKGDDE